jgi:hypothetical protein
MIFISTLSPFLTEGQTSLDASLLLQDHALNHHSVLPLVLTVSFPPGPDALNRPEMVAVDLAVMPVAHSHSTNLRHLQVLIILLIYSFHLIRYKSRYFRPCQIAGLNIAMGVDRYRPHRATLGMSPDPSNHPHKS